MTKKDSYLRSSNIELLRIFAMLSIVLCHFLMGVSEYIKTRPDSKLYFFYLFFHGWTGAFGNSLFMIISGYFMCTSEFKWQKMLKIWFNIFSVSVIIGTIFFVFRIPSQGFSILQDESFLDSAKPLSKMQYLKCFFPTILGLTWYASRFLVFYAFSPLCKKLLDKLDRSWHFYLVVLMFILGTITKMIPAQRLYSPSNLFYFFFAYFLAAYIKFYNPKLFSHKNLNLISGITAIIIIGTWNTFLALFINSHSNYEKYSRFFELTQIHMFPIWIASIFIFNYFRLIEIKNSKIINAISISTFDTYLLHRNFVMSPFIWSVIFHVDSLIKSSCPFLALLSIPGLLLLGTILHYLRVYLIEKPILPSLEKIIGRIMN